MGATILKRKILKRTVLKRTIPRRTILKRSGRGASPALGTDGPAPRPRPALATRLPLIAGVAVLAGCASGGGGPPVAGEAAEATYALYSGRWTLDESTSSAQIPNYLEGVRDETEVADIARNETREMRRYRRMYESRRISVSNMRATIEVLRRRPETLVITLNADGLVYTPIPGATLTLPIDGTEVEVREGEHRVRSKIEWEGPLLAIQHQVVSGGMVRETLEVVGDRMIMTRAMTGAGSGEPLLLAFDRG